MPVVRVLPHAADAFDPGQPFPHFYFHFASTYASWLNPVEYWFSAMCWPAVPWPAWPICGPPWAATCAATTCERCPDQIAGA